jgi:hypothetical protein
MKKCILLLALLIGTAFLWADDAETGDAEKPPFRFKNRMVELGLGVRAGFANNFLSAGDIFQDTLIIDFSTLDDSLQMNMGLFLSPHFFNFNWKDIWGFGIYINTEAEGTLSLSEKLLNFKKADGDPFGVGAAVFAEVGGNAFFYIKKFKVKLNSALFYPLIYTEPSMSYTYKTGKNSDGNETLAFTIDYDMTIYSAFPMENLENMDGLTGRMGFDFGGGVEYPLFSFLDLGADVTHIPLVPAELHDYMRIKGTVGIKETDDIIGADMDSIVSTDGGETTYGTDSKIILRPFKLVTWAEYRPFDSQLLSIIPSLGFAINPLYDKPGSLEAGIRLRCDLANIFIPTIGFVYEDRLWKNSLDMRLNLRAFELDLGIGMQSQDFVKSWTAGGLFASLGIKMGW